MYDIINILPEILLDAERFVIDNDRSLYVLFFIALEKFCVNNGIIIGGEMGINLLVDSPLTKDSYTWDLYTENPYNIAKKLAQALYCAKPPHVNSKYITMRSDLRHQEMTIIINTRQIIKIYNMDRYRNINLAKLMGPASRAGYYSHNKVLLIPEEMQLIEIYRTLYTPAKVGQWKSYLEFEQKIYSLIGNLKKKVLKTGGAISVNRAVIDQILLEKIIAGSDNVLVGDYALGYLGSTLTQSPRVQFISSMHVADLAAAIGIEINKQLPNLQLYGYKVTFIKYSLNLPTDFQITKHTLYINFDKEQIPIVDIFNSSIFEMIPYWIVGRIDQVKLSKPLLSKTIKPIKIGNPWVLLRFRFIDLWVLKLITKINDQESKFLNNKILFLLNSICSLRKLTMSQLNNDPSRLFQITDYTGVYISETVAKKKLIKKTGERFAMYYPVKEADCPDIKKDLNQD